MRLMRKPEVESLVGLSGTQVDNLERRGDFPRRVVLSPRAVAWVESEITAWCLARAAARQDRQASEAAYVARLPAPVRRRREMARSAPGAKRPTPGGAAAIAA